VDDGARSLEEARAIASAAAGEGVTAIAATPHVREDYPTSADRMEQEVEGLRTDFAAEGLPVEVLMGGEVDVDLLASLSPDDVRRFTLAQTGRYLLLEFPYFGWHAALEPAVHRLLRAGVTPLLAHPERNRAVQEDPARLVPLVEAGALVQITASSLDGSLGRSARAAGRRLLELGLGHVLASDAHGPHLAREAGLGTAAAELGDDGLARYLTEEAPAAIVSGEPVPPPPRSRRRFRIPFLR
jgi:protein-tyrosine phosphatase